MKPSTRQPRRRTARDGRGAAAAICAARSLASAAAILALAILAGCSPDLRETMGPRIPLPNLTGRVLRDGSPVADRKVKLEDASTDSTIAEERTDASGRFAFSDVGAGSWVLKVSSSEAGDFASVACAFVFVTPDTSFEAPPLDLYAGEVGARSPEDDHECPPPSPFAPLTFEWTLPEDEPSTMQVRVYDAEGRPVWYGEKSRAESALWNGLGNQPGDYMNRVVREGDYYWRMRLERDDSPIEWTTAPRDLLFRRDAP